MTDSKHILAVNRKIAEVLDHTMIGTCPYVFSWADRAVSSKSPSDHGQRLHNWMESWHDVGPLVEEMISGPWEINLRESARGIYVAECRSDGHEFDALASTLCAAICYAYLRSKGIENPERLGVERE